VWPIQTARTQVSRHAQLRGADGTDGIVVTTVGAFWNVNWAFLGAWSRLRPAFFGQKRRGVEASSLWQTALK
jgi:hypothetical protein